MFVTLEAKNLIETLINQLKNKQQNNINLSINCDYQINICESLLYEGMHKLKFINKEEK